MRALVLAGLAGLALAASACDPASPSLRLRLAGGPAQPCPSTSCLEVGMACATWISIRILDPADPSAPYLSQCVRVPANRSADLCSLANVDLDPTSLPLRDLEVQVAVYPEAAIEIDPLTGEGTCPTNVQYDAANGFPVESGTTPALGGRGYYRPGDEQVVVTLGCTNLELINEATCVGAATVAVSATVEDFDLRLSLDANEARRLSVAVGEPVPSNERYVLNPGDVSPLVRVVTSWRGEVEAQFTSAACLTVLDDTPQSTTSVICQRASELDDSLTFTGRLTGMRLRSTTLDQILAALGQLQFPPEGVTIGVVLDANREPLTNRVVSAPDATILYLSADRTSVGGSATSANGIFISTDAPFGTTFSTIGGPIATATSLGGLIEGKVTIAVLQFDEPVVGGGN